MTPQLAPEPWWKPWQWILAALVIAVPPIVSSYLTTLSMNKSKQEATIKTQQRAWINPNDLRCYTENFTKLNSSIVQVRQGYAMASLICPSGNVLLQVKNSDSNVTLTWFTFEDIISHQSAIASNPMPFNLSDPALAQSSVQAVNYLVAQSKPAVQNRPKDTKICSNIKNNILTLVINTTKGRCIKQQINIATGEVIQTNAISCINPSCVN